MKRTYKVLFWITFSILIISNLFWIYQTLDTAVGHSYYKVSCNEYYQDMLEFRKLLETNLTKEKTIKFLEKNNVKYDSIQKGSDYIIVFNSFALEFDKDGALKKNE